MAALLPDDLLHMICHHLWDQRDFDTLYRCACSGKQLAIPALAALYRMHEQAPITDARSDELEISAPEQEAQTSQTKGKDSTLMKRAIMWRSMVLSSMGKTLFPYSKYIRILRLQDLESLLQNEKFVGKISSALFEDNIQEFEVKKSIQYKGKEYFAIDVEATSSRLADVITKQSPMLEELSGNIFHDVLLRCIPRLPNLQELNVFRGEVLEGTGKLLRSHCPSFRALQFYGWQHPDSDHQFATFLDDLRPQSLESFVIYSVSQIGAESFLAMNSHKDSLKELKLNAIKADAVPSISLLKDCTKLNMLVLSENGVATQDLEKRHNDVFLETIAWLRSCKYLKTISMENMLSGQGLLKPALLENDIQLTELKLDGYSMPEGRDFYQALASQTSLKDLWLKGGSSDIGSDADILVESLSKLENLTELRLQDNSDYFSDRHICKLAKNLHRLEGWFTGGFGLTDAIWSDMASLRSLRRLNLNALTRFTTDGILEFVQNLGPGNKGLYLNIMMADMDFDLSEVEQGIIREAIDAKVGGQFEFMLIRDPDVSSSEEDSD